MSTATQSTYFTSTLSREALLESFRRVRAFSRHLAEPLEVEDYVVQSMTEASPTRWHLAHTTWFFETFVLEAADSAYQSPHPEYTYLFNSYYVQAGERYPRPRRGLITRPTVAEVYQYREYLDGQVEQFIREADEERLEHFTPIIEIGVHHEQQHQELILTDLKHALSFNPLHPVYRERGQVPAREAGELDWVGFEEGVYELGHDAASFCYDNETPRHRHFLESFQLADRLVTNREFAEFIEDGGYRTQTLWLDEGFFEARSRSWEAPHYWKKQDGGWHSFTLGGLRPVEPEEPVCHLSHFEADAYARWAGARLPREAEWEVAARQLPPQGNFVDEGHYHPVADPGGEGLRQMWGDVWEWTQSPYTAYPGYRPVKGALGEYNGKFMSNQIVLRGGSCATSRSHVRPTYRNFFPSTARWQFAGVRLARDAG